MYYVIHVIKAEFNESANDVSVLGIFDENNVRRCLMQYIRDERWELDSLNGETLTVIVNKILANEDFAHNDCGTIYSFITKKIKLNNVDETYILSYDSCD